MAKNDGQLLNELYLCLSAMQNIDKDSLVKVLQPKRQGIEKAIFDQEVSTDEQLKLITDYLALIDIYYSKNKHAKKNDEHIAHLITACFTVGYAMGLGKECVPLLPVLALSGANIEKGNQIMSAFKKAHLQPKAK